MPAAGRVEHGRVHLGAEALVTPLQGKPEMQPRVSPTAIETRWYPAGTLNASDGVLPDGTPEFPGKVQGEWICWGFHVGRGAKTAEGPIVVTTQLYQLGEGAGGKPSSRAVTSCPRWEFR